MLGEVRYFEDLEAWKMSRRLANMIYAVSRKGIFRDDPGWSDQVQRAVVSIMNNIAEGFERGSNKDFVRFLFMAKGSAGEVRSLLYVALDQGYITKEQFDSMRQTSVETARLIWGLIKSLRGKLDWVTGMKVLFAAILP